MDLVAALSCSDSHGTLLPATLATIVAACSLQLQAQHPFLAAQTSSSFLQPVT